ncbi:MAG: TetR/AcrR family transcriptional regulator, partial [Dongia sp.]
PKAPATVRDAAGELIKTTLSEVGKRFSETRRTPAEIEAYANAMADMFSAYLRSLGKA